jgi:hypothetical protein
MTKTHFTQNPRRRGQSIKLIHDNVGSRARVKLVVLNPGATPSGTLTPGIDEWTADRNRCQDDHTGGLD